MTKRTRRPLWTTGATSGLPVWRAAVSALCIGVNAGVPTHRAPSTRSSTSSKESKTDCDAKAPSDSPHTNSAGRSASSMGSSSARTARKSAAEASCAGSRPVSQFSAEGT